MDIIGVSCQWKSGEGSRGDWAHSHWPDKQILQWLTEMWYQKTYIYTYIISRLKTWINKWINHKYVYIYILTHVYLYMHAHTHTHVHIRNYVIMHVSKFEARNKCPILTWRDCNFNFANACSACPQTWSGPRCRHRRRANSQHSTRQQRMLPPGQSWK